MKVDDLERLRLIESELVQIKQNKEDLQTANPLWSLYCCFTGTVLQQSHGAVISMTLHEQRIGNFCVPFRHGQVRMTHLLLECEQIPAVLEPECSEAVSDLIRREFCAGAFTVFSEVPT